MPRNAKLGDAVNETNEDNTGESPKFSGLGEPCDDPNQCFMPYSRNRSVVSCRHGLCACADGHVRMDADCAKLKDETAESSTLEKCIFLIVAAVLLSMPLD